MTDHHSTTAAPDAAELVATLRGYVERYQRQHGHPPAGVVIGRAEWEALGRPEMAAGVRIQPTAAP
ncbi:MAG: hypothetical protein ACQEXC_09465 [Pseudomonadota bacterium]